MALDLWPSEKKGHKPKVPLLHRRERLDPAYVWGKRFEPQWVIEPSRTIGKDVVLLSETEAVMIRGKADDSAFFLDPNQQAVIVALPGDPDSYIEYRVERYVRKIPCKQYGLPYLEEPEKNIQILVGREIRKGKVVREWEEDFEEVPLWHFIDVGCLGSSDWRSKFAEHIN